MPKITLQEITSLQNNQAINRLNQNFDAIEQAFDNMLALDGTDPNQLQDHIDANGYKVTNLATGTAATDSVNLQQVTDLITGATPVSIVGKEEFIDLDDTPSAYTGQAGKSVVVNGTEDGVEFATISSSPTTTQGDLIRRGASADERLAVGSNGQVLTVVSGVPAWASASAARYPEYFEDFISHQHGASANAQSEWVFSSTGTGASFSANASEADHPGVVSFTSGTASTGLARHASSFGSPTAFDRRSIIQPSGSNVLVFETAIKCSAAATGALQYMLPLGATGATNHYIHARVTNNGLEIYNDNGSGAANIVTASSGITANTWHILRFQLGSSTLELYVDGTLVASTSTKITTNDLTLENYSYNGGTAGTSYTLYLDWIRVFQAAPQRLLTQEIY